MNKTWIPGDRGFLGKAMLRAFPEAIRQGTYRYEIFANALNAMESARPDIVINCAGKVGGILANRTMPGSFFYENIMIGANLMEAARQIGVKRYVQVGSVCSYPEVCPMPMSEADFWNGEPEPTNGAYGAAKRALVSMAQSYAKQYDFPAVLPILANIYGPGDHYEPERSHVIPAMIRKFMEAKEKLEPVVLWGTGKCSREFLFVDDAAAAIRFLVENDDSGEIFNVSSGHEVTIRELAEIVASATGFHGDIRWDTSKPDGQPRRNFDTSRLAKAGWTAPTNLRDGINQSVADYKRWKQENQCLDYRSSCPSDGLPLTALIGT